MTEEAGGKHPQKPEDTCETCHHPTCMQRTTKSNAWTVCKQRKAAPPPKRLQRCDHECVCFLMPDVENNVPVNPCTAEHCEWDTRNSSAPQPAADPTRYMTEEQRKYILSFKEEDPLLMAYAEGQKDAEQRIKDVIAELKRRSEENGKKGLADDTKWGHYFTGMAAAQEEAISLLRGDGKP